MKKEPKQKSAIKPNPDEKNQKMIIFKSVYTEAVYLWNGFVVITILGNKYRPFGKIMTGFKDTDFNRIHKTIKHVFFVENAPYRILAKV